MADQSIPQRFQSLGAGFQGRLPELREERRLEDVERRQAMALDFRDIANFTVSGNIDQALTKVNNRLLEINRLGGDPASTQFVKTLLEQGETEEALTFLGDIDQRFVSEGLLEARQQATVLPASSISATGQIATQQPGGGIGLETLPGFVPDPTRGARGQISGTIQVKDEEGNLFNSATIFDPSTGTTQQALTPVGGGTATPVGQVEQVDSAGLTAKERIEQRGLEAGTARAAIVAIDASKDAFDQLGGIEQSIATFDEALTLLDDEGVDTGPILARLPTFRQAAIELENIQSRLGLNVIQNTTFGSLSEAELAFALSSALPTALQPAALKDWINRKRDAQRKLAGNIKEAAFFLGIPGNTIPKWLEFQEQRQLLNSTQPTADTAPGTVLQFDELGNLIP